MTGVPSTMVGESEALCEGMSMSVGESELEGRPEDGPESETVRVAAFPFASGPSPREKDEPFSAIKVCFGRHPQRKGGGRTFA